MKQKLTIISLLLLTALTGRINAQVVINEYSCSNLSSFADNYSKHEDWIELYNSGSSPVNLTGYHLSDDSLNATKYTMPSVIIAANGFARFWCSGRNVTVGTHYHTNFKLTQTKNNKEDIVFSDPGGNILDGVKLHLTQLAHSYGRKPDGTATWGLFTSATPNASNNNSTQYLRYADKPDMHLTAGFHTGSQIDTITTTEPNSSIRYTIDGTRPLATSPVYSTPLTVGVTRTVKAITFSTDPQILPSFMEFETYFINVSHTVPVVSIAGTNLTNLANGTGSLEPEGSFEMFDTLGNRVAQTYGDFNRHGQDSWANSQRSMDFKSHDEMGYNHSIEEQLFWTSPRDNFQGVILRAAGDDNYPADHHTANLGSAHMRDAYVQELANQGGLNLDVRKASKCVIYLNGAYWGVYDIRERCDEHDYTSYYYGQDKYHLLMIETWGNTWAEYGGAQAFAEWNSLYSYIMNNNMAVPANFQYVTDRLDWTSLVDYLIVNSFTVCSDWLNYNTGWWRGTDSTGTHLRWGYNLWDNDATFDFYINYTGIPSTLYTADPCQIETLSGNSDPEGHIVLLDRLRDNPDFNNYYITRQMDLWNTVFSCDNMLTKLDSMKAVIDPEMTAHAARWNGTYTEWETNFQTLRSFISNRCNYLATGFNNCYGTTGPYDLVIDATPANAGTVQLNSLTINQFPWAGKYFGNIDTKLKATADTMYSFVNWTANTQTFNPNATDPSVKTVLIGADTIVAHFNLSVSINEMLESSATSVTAYPSVFNQQTTIDFYLPENENVSLKLFTIEGKEISTLISDSKTASQGSYKMTLDFSNRSLTPGIYLLDFIAGDYHKNIKLVYTGK